MKLDKYLFDGNEKPNMKKLPTDSKDDDVAKEKILKQTAEYQEKIVQLQDKFYADGREGLIIVLQAMDAAGKDSIIKHVMTVMNPQGVDVHSFKQPTSDDLAHDFLWRVNNCLPARGKIAIFNRSHYEDVLVVQVHNLHKNYKMAPRVIEEEKSEFFKKRYRQIRNYEEYLYENSYRVVKIFLHVSMDEQKERFLERIDDRTKNWKFSSADLKERALFEEYMTTYEEVIENTATEHSPWYVVPADQKWYTRYLISKILLEALEACDAEYPVMPAQEETKLREYHDALMQEDVAFAKEHREKLREKE